MVLEELSNLRTSAPPELLTHNEIMANGLVQPSVSTIGDLEPPLDLLDLLVSPDIADELSIVFRTDPLQFLLAYELPEFKLRPMAPVLPTASSRKTKRERKAKSSKKRAERQVVAPATEADSEMAMSCATDLNSAHFQAMSAEIDTATTPTAAMTFSSPGLEASSEAEQVLGKRKRTKQAPLHPGTDAEVLTDINPKASFTLFDKGWILDPGVRRGGRVRIERLPELLTKKRPKGKYIFLDWIVNGEETRRSCIHSSHEGRCIFWDASRRRWSCWIRSIFRFLVLCCPPEFSFGYIGRSRDG